MGKGNEGREKKQGRPHIRNGTSLFPRKEAVEPERDPWQHERWIRKIRKLIGSTSSERRDLFMKKRYVSAQ